MNTFPSPWSVQVINHGHIISVQEFTDSADARAWFKKASTDPDWIGPGMTVKLRKRGKVLKEITK